MVASSRVNTRRRYFCVMMNNEIETLILAGLLVLLVALGVALARRKKFDPKMAFLLALLQDLPVGGEETGESDKSGDANEPARPGSGPGSRISDFFA
jgi:hypothetical protein